MTFEPEPIRDTLRAVWRSHANRPALVTDGGSATFAELHDRSFRLAAAFASLGVVPGDAVCCLLSTDFNSLIEVRLATYELGATLFALPPTLLGSGDELIQRVVPRVVLFDLQQLPGLPEWLRHVLPNAVSVPIRGAAGDYDGLLARHDPRPPERDFDPEILSAVGFTSGTTGPPKGITASHRASDWSSAMMRRLLGGDDSLADTGILIGIPLFAAGGGVVTPALASGCTVYAPYRFDAIQALRLIDSGRVSAAFLTPSMVIDLLDVPDLERIDLSGLRTIVYGTSIMPVPKLEEAIRRIGPVFMGGYGMAEVLPPVTVLQPEEHGTKSQPAEPEVLSSVGRPVDGVTVRVVDGDCGSVDGHRVGEVEIRSPAVTKGYWCDDQRTRSATNDGWWRSGDIGYLDASDRLHVLSRRADLLWSRGSAVYPRHIEEACSLHPAVKEACAVQRAADAPLVIAVSLRRGAPSDGGDDAISRELRQLVERHVPGSAEIDDIIVCEEIPRSVQGKVLHREVRDTMTPDGGSGSA